MEPLRIPSEEEINTAYEQGKEAVAALIHSSLQQFIVRIQALEDQIAKNSGNSILCTRLRPDRNAGLFYSDQ